MYDGYYIYSEYYNDTNGEYQYGLKPYIYYSCRYKNDKNDDFVVNFTLDNRITIYGIINGEYKTKSGSLINPELIDENSIETTEYTYIDSNGNRHRHEYVVSVTYDGVKIEKEILTEQLITLDENNNATRDTYEYVMYSNRKVYKDGEGYFWNNNNKKQYITDEETLNFVQHMTSDGHLYSNSAAQYYADAYYFSKWVNENLGDITQENAVDDEGNPITDFAINTGNEKIFNLSADNNNPLKDGSTFQENRISVIRKSILSNLSTAIANFNSSANTYEFVMPVFGEEDWEKVTNNISVATFMQGIPIGSKFYNNYCVITNDKNEEFVSEDSIYVITEDGQVHLPTCKKVLGEDEENHKVVQAYNNVDYERQTVVKTEGDEVYFYPRAEEKCYDCLVNIAQAYDINDIIDGELKIYDKESDEYEIDNTATSRLEDTNLRKVYLTALARKRYDLYKNIELENGKYTDSLKPEIVSVTPGFNNALIHAKGANNIIGYAVTEKDEMPENFEKCDIKLSGNVTKSGLKPNQVYYAWVEDDKGNISDSYQFRTISIDDINIRFTVVLNGEEWQQSRTVTAELYNGNTELADGDGSLILQTSMDGKNWTDESSKTFTQDGTIYAQVKGYESKINAQMNITKVDGTAPIINRQLYSSGVTTNGFTLNIDVKDGESGISKIIWYYKLSNADKYTTEEDVYTPMNQAAAGATTQVSKNHTFTNLAAGTYKAYAEVYNVAGGMTKSNEITVNSISTPNGASARPTTWTNGDVTVTLPTSNGFTTQYQTGTSININGNWNTYNGEFTVSSNTNVYYRYYDGENAGSYGTLTISNIDKSKPTIGDVKGSTQPGNTGTVTVNNIADTGSGVVGIYISTNNATPAVEASGWENNTSASYTKTVFSNGTYYVWVKDGAGNVSEGKMCEVSGIVEKVTGVTLTDATVDIGSTVTIERTMIGSNSYKSIKFTSSNTAVATIESGTGVATGVSGGTTTITCTVTNYDGSQVSGTCTLTVEDAIYLIKNDECIGDYSWQSFNGYENEKKNSITNTNNSGANDITKRIPIKDEWKGKSLYMEYEYRAITTCINDYTDGNNKLKLAFRNAKAQGDYEKVFKSERVTKKNHVSEDKIKINNKNRNLWGIKGSIDNQIIPDDCGYLYFTISIDADDAYDAGYADLIIHNLYIK